MTVAKCKVPVQSEFMAALCQGKTRQKIIELGAFVDTEGVDLRKEISAFKMEVSSLKDHISKSREEIISAIQETNVTDV